MFHQRKRLICLSLRSTNFHWLHHYYEEIRLLLIHYTLLTFQSLDSCLVPWNKLKALPGTLYIPCILAMLCDPGGIRCSHHYEHVILLATRLKVSASTLNFSRLRCFRFLLTALMLSCLRLNLTSRLRLQGWILTAG